MRVITHYSTRPEHPLTAPFPRTNGVLFVIRSGDFYSPDSWDTTKVTEYVRGYVRYRPFLSARLGRFGFYIGWKAYGVDTENQSKMPGVRPEDVYVGSVALQGFTARPTRGL